MNLHEIMEMRRIMYASNDSVIEDFLDDFVPKLLKSMARTTGARVNRNEYLSAITEVASYHYNDGLGVGVIKKILEEVKTFKRTHIKSVQRTFIALNHVQLQLEREGSMPNDVVIQLLTEYTPKFTQNSDMDWLDGFAGAAGVRKLACGHYSSSTHYLVGDAETWTSTTECCTSCVSELINSNVRTRQYGSRYVLVEHAVDCLTSNGTTIQDRRNPNIHQLPNGRYADNTYNPHANIVRGYHSSKERGFNVISSQWYESHRRAFGCELEVQVLNSGNINAFAGKVHDVLNPSGELGEYCFFERDGSIGNGFEMITQPAGLDVHREKFSLWLNNPQIKRGTRSHEGGNCGLHVHVGRDYLSQAQIFRVQSFLNDPKNEPLIRQIARRYDVGFCRPKSDLVKLSPKGKGSRDRYEMLNVSGDKTVEFRIFRGSLRYESVMAALEFCNALLVFCQPGEVAFTKFNSLGFREFIHRIEMREDTKFLRAYISGDEDADQEQAAA